jgi:tight adherence protein C
MSALLIAAAVFVAGGAIRPRRLRLDPFLASAAPGPAPRPRRLRVPGAAMFGAVAGLLVAAGVGAGAVSAAALGAAAGALIRRAAASTRRQHRTRRLDLELPTVADTLALHVLAGDPVFAALHRFAADASGVAAQEVRRLLTDDGDGLETALRRAAAHSESTEAARLFDLLAHAHRTGGRLAEALSALADDYRASIASDLTAEGGRRSLAVYGPILALMVPVTLVFLMYPTLAGLTALSQP